MERTETHRLLTDTFPNWADFVAHAAPHVTDDAFASPSAPVFRGASSVAEVMDLASNGWPDGIQEANQIAESALELIDQDIQVTRYEAQWLLAGSEVDVSRYLSGVPENMIEYEPFITSNAGKVVTVCASVGALANYGAGQLIKRGANVLALIRALEETQHSVEVWLDSTVVRDYAHKGTKGRVRVLLKGANDSVDPAVIAFALGHPASLRVFTFAARMAWPEDWNQRLEIGKAFSTGSMGSSVDPIEDLPDGTIYLPCLGDGRSTDVLGGEFVEAKLRSLGLLGAQETD